MDPSDITSAGKSEVSGFGREFFLEITLDNLPKFVGQEVGVSSWLDITQEDINNFGENTRDIDPMHMDPEWAKKNSPFGVTIAFGFQTLSYLTHFLHEVLPWPCEVTHGLNYGIERVRFLNPVLVGSRIRARMSLTDLKVNEQEDYRVRLNCVVEIEGNDKPAMVADWIGLLVTEAPKVGRK